MRFISSNAQKIMEYERLLAPVEFTPVQMEMKPPQGNNELEIVRSKVLIAYQIKRAALFVDHTTLSLPAWNGLPGSMSEEFWKRLGVEGFLRLLSSNNDRRARAKTVIGYCDSRKIITFAGEITGTIASEPAGDSSSWELVFIPDGQEKTMAQMDLEEKNKISMRRIAAEKFREYIMCGAGGRFCF